MVSITMSLSDLMVNISTDNIVYIIFILIKFYILCEHVLIKKIFKHYHRNIINTRFCKLNKIFIKLILKNQYNDENLLNLTLVQLLKKISRQVYFD